MTTAESIYTIGQQLKKERTKQGLSVSLIAATLGLTDHLVEMIESDQGLETSLSPLILKNYIASYAEYLQLDVPQLMAAYPEEEQIEIVELEGNEDIVHQQTTWVDYAVRGILAVLIMTTISLSIYWFRENVYQSFKPDEFKAEFNDALQANNPAINQLLSKNELNKQSAEFSTMHSERMPEIAANTSTLILSSSASSWAKVKDTHNKVLFDGMVTSKEPVEIIGDAPFIVLLGNASIVEAKLNNKTMTTPKIQGMARIVYKEG